VSPLRSYGRVRLVPLVDLHPRRDPVFGSGGLVTSRWRFSSRRKPRSSSSCHCVTASAGGGRAGESVVNRSTTSAKRSAHTRRLFLRHWEIELDFMAEAHVALTSACRHERSGPLLAESMSPVRRRDLQRQRRLVRRRLHVQVPSLITGATSRRHRRSPYWITAVVRPTCRHGIGRHRVEALLPVGIRSSPGNSKREQIHPPSP